MSLYPEAKRLGWPRHPAASSYRNPYASMRPGPKPSYKIYRCVDCLTEVSRAGVRCLPCAKRLQRRENPTTKRIITAVKSGKYTTQTCVAMEVGVSRERVRQILNAEGYSEFGHRVGFRLEWPCPECREEISLRRYELQALVHMPAHCRSCAKKYCQREHLRSEHTDKWGTCRLCVKIWQQRIVEIRTCERCGKDLPISRNQLHQIQLGHGTGKFHRACYNEELSENPPAKKHKPANPGGA